MLKDLNKREQVKELLKEWKTTLEIIKEVKCWPQMIWAVRKELKWVLKDENIEKEQLSSLDKAELEKLRIVAWLTPAQLKDMLSQSQISHKKDIDINIWEPWEIKLWIVSDTHLNNKLCDIESLHKFYEDADKEWVDAFIHAGDLTDWINVYPWHIYELMNLSFDDQLKYVEENYPKIEWKQTYFISWNHDEARLKQGGMNFGNVVSKLRDDMIHLGFYNANIHLNWFSLELQHWWWWSPYAISYHLQKYMERIPQKEPIDLFVLWHYHRELFMMYRWALALLPWAFLKENLLAKRFKLGNNIAGWLLDIKRDKDWKVTYAPILHKYQ